MARPVYHLITGEYPPAPGGVGDYSALLAAALGAAGAEVHVWTGPADGPAVEAPGVVVHREPGRWSPAGLARLGAALDAFPGPRRLVVQYVPNAWGYKGLNVFFGRWLLRRRRAGDAIRVTFHEVSYTVEPGDPPARRALAAVHRVMARSVLAAAAAVDVTIPAWEERLRGFAPRDRRPIAVRPVPSNVPVVTDPAGVAAVRRRVAPGGGPVVGSFGSFADVVGELLAAALPPLLADRPGRVALLVGRKGDRLAARLVEAHPDLAGRVVATGGLSPDDASRHLQACDVLVQPYPDGVSGRRGSLMAGLAHGVAIATNAGHLTEPFWGESAAVALAPSPDPAALVEAAERLLADPDLRARVGAAARALHDRRCAIGRAVEALVGAPAGVAP